MLYLRRHFYDGCYFYRIDDFLWAHFLGLYCLVLKSIRGCLCQSFIGSAG